jgi:hypothetical protein
MRNLKAEFDKLAVIEPQLRRLEEDVRHAGRDRMRHWYDVVKPQITGFVGDGCFVADPRLRGTVNYDIVYQYLLDVYGV